MVKILMVCLGNICRSPLAEGILKSKIKENKLNAIVESCGFEEYHLGCQPDGRAIEVAGKYGIDITSQRARLFKKDYFDYYDKILVMDQNNFRMVAAKARTKNDLEKVDFIMNIIYPGSNTPVPDPYYGGRDNFQQTWDMLDRASDKIIELIKSGEWR